MHTKENFLIYFDIFAAANVMLTFSNAFQPFRL